MPAATIRKPDREYESATNVKETLESILVAFVLAFIFRAFIVEAFVIPTGSMGPTLLGAHTHWRCPDCGYEWDANFTDRRAAPNPNDPDDVAIPTRAAHEDKAGVTAFTYNLRCPNCGYRMPPVEAPPVYFGDRILVLKYQYVYQEPNRWDVVVFKAPLGPPSIEEYSQSFIKRLVGLPGDELMVLDGDIYVKRDSDKDFHIQTKPRAAQEALWREVSNVDYQPRQLNRAPDSAWKVPWQPDGGAGWNTSSRVFSFSNSAGSGKLKFDSTVNPGTFALSDLVGYDQTRGQDIAGDYSDQDYALNNLVRFNVLDVKLDLFYERKAGDGPLRLRMTKYDDAFTAVIDSGQVRLERSAANTEQGVTIAQAPLPDNGGKPRHIEYSNVDYVVTLRIDGNDVLTTQNENDKRPDYYSPDIHKLMDNYHALRRVGLGEASSAEREPLNPRPTISITAENQACEIHHLRLLRDAYYTPYMLGGSSSGWANNATPDDPVQLGKDDYFVCGDNSPMSYDARFWTDTVDLRENENLFNSPGRVPRRFMIGRAFFVYWPAGYRPFGDDTWGIVPNLGDMRFIH